MMTHHTSKLVLLILERAHSCGKAERFLGYWQCFDYQSGDAYKGLFDNLL